MLTCGLTDTLEAQFIYVENVYSGTIGEYGPDGSTINASLISGLSNPNGIAISGNDLFVATQNPGTIGKYTTSGATVNSSLITGFDSPQGLAVSENNLFVSNTGDGTVGEYTTSGATVNANLISGLSGPYGIAITQAPEPTTSALAALGVATLCLRRRRKPSAIVHPAARATGTVVLPIPSA